jgi:hypothetical protein
LLNEKHALAVQGAETAWKTLAPQMKQCYMWVDYCCIDQDENPAGELQALDQIVQVGVACLCNHQCRLVDQRTDLRLHSHANCRPQPWILAAES